MPDRPTALLPPAALLLDFGGVLADAPPQRAAPPELVLRLYNLTRGSGSARRPEDRALGVAQTGVLTPGEIQRSLTEGQAAYARWRDEDWPDELPQAEVWERFVIGAWPRTAQAAVRASVAKLSYDWARRNNWALRPGVTELLHAVSAAHIPMAVVSNTLCGAAHRDFLAKAAVGGLFDAQIYSDEAGVRKPNPQMIWRATDELGVRPESCWFVGDSRRRDVLCARRAVAAAAILMRSGRTDHEDSDRWPEPDAVVSDGFELLDLVLDGRSEG